MPLLGQSYKEVIRGRHRALLLWLKIPIPCFQQSWSPNQGNGRVVRSLRTVRRKCVKYLRCQTLRFTILMQSAVSSQQSAVSSQQSAVSSQQSAVSSQQSAVSSQQIFTSGGRCLRLSGLAMSCPAVTGWIWYAKWAPAAFESFATFRGCEVASTLTSSTSPNSCGTSQKIRSHKQ